MKKLGKILIDAITLSVCWFMIILTFCAFIG